MTQAGGVAQFLQWAVVEEGASLVDSRDVKNYFIRGAKRDARVTYPSREWGYGRLNVAGVLTSLANY